MKKVDHNKAAQSNPQPYVGTVTLPDGTECEVTKRANFLELPPLVKRYGDWAISAEGIHSLVVNYTIEMERLDKHDWIKQLEPKPWVKDTDSLADALKTAKELLKLGED